MTPIQDHPGYYWRTNDAADLRFNESGPDQPQNIKCFNMQDHLNSGETRFVPVEGLVLLATGVFGEARPTSVTSTTRWTGSSHRYGIYRNPSGLYKTGVVMLETHGGGMCGYAFDSLIAGDTWTYIAASFTPEMLWNLCNQIARAYSAARDAERSNVLRAFLEGRLKKKRRNGLVRAHLENAA